MLACFAALRLELIIPLGLDEEKEYPLLLIMYVTLLLTLFDPLLNEKAEKQIPGTNDDFYIFFLTFFLHTLVRWCGELLHGLNSCLSTCPLPVTAPLVVRL